MLSHSFVLNAMEGYADTMSNFEELVEEHRADPVRSRLKQYVPTIGTFFTPLPMRQAFEVYDRKYAVSKRRHLPPTFNEVRHMLNLAQVLALSQTLSLITFDGDQTLYTDGSNFEDNEELARSIVALLKSGVRCAVVTAAGYGLNGPKYEIRLRGLLDRFISYNLTAEEVERFFVLGGECNYLLMCKLSETEPKKAVLTPITPEVWQAPELNGPRPSFWPEEQVSTV